MLRIGRLAGAALGPGFRRPRPQLAPLSCAFFHNTQVGDVIPIQFRVQGEDAVIKPDDEYPDYLWDVLESPSLAELMAKQSEGVPLTPSQSRRLWQKARTAQIKENNLTAGL